MFNLKTMNYSTLKKTAVLSVVSLVFAGALSAQTSDTTKMAGATSAKIFGGRAQYRTWNIGISGGVTSNQIVLGGTNDFNTPKINVAAQLSVRKQLAHSFGIEGDLLSGWVTGSNTALAGDNSPGAKSIYPKGGFSQFNTHFYSGTINGVINVATVDYLRRKNAINFFVNAGLGLTRFATKDLLYPSGTWAWFKNPAGGTHIIDEMIIPVGGGVKFRLSDAVAFNLGYNMYFVDGDTFDGSKVDGLLHKDKYSYGYGGLEFSLGSKSKPNLDWVNPVAMMYDELNDPTLRQEVEALKGRVSNVEKAVEDLKKDSDGDGVADQFDKCPNTPAGTVVDGSGCPIKFPTVDTSAIINAVKNAGAPKVSTAPYSNIQFEFDSSVLKTSSYPILDATSADLRSSKKKVLVNGYASAEGTAAHNLKLSKDRANSVKTYLVNSGVDAKRLTAKGYGETNPVADNSTEDGRVLNRRVEFKVK